MKKWISLLLAALLLFPAGVSAPTGAASAFPEEPAAASEPAAPEDTEPEAPAGEPEEIYTCETREEAIRFIRAHMTARVAAFSLRCAEEAPITSEDIVAYEGSAPDEGDYLRFNIKDLRISAKNGEITVQAEYRTSAAQEQELNAVIAEILASCDVSALTDYQKALWAFDAVCENVTYAEEDAGETAYTAYGALKDGKAKCQGYALSYYRLARALGVDCRILVGEMTENGITNTHAWNAVKLGESWYYVDATGGDSANNRYEWFFSPLTGEGFEVNAQYDAGMGDDVFYTADEVREYTFNESIFGTCGDAVTWTLEPLTGLLRIDGEGEVEAFPDGELYWREYDKIITAAFIVPTVTALWDGSFEGCAYPLHAVPGSAAESYITEKTLPHHTLSLMKEIPATCAETGRTEGWKCDACNTVFTGNELIPTNDDHSDADANDICDVCGLPLNYTAGGLCGDALRWYFYDNGELIVTGEGRMKDYYTSGKNAAPWSGYRNTISTLTVLPGVESVGNYAFYKCIALTDVHFSDTVTEIGNYAFSGCTSLSEIALPEQIKKLGYSAFENTAFTTVTIPDSLTESKYSYFEGPFANSAVETAVFAEGATVVSYGLFASAKNLKTLVFRTPETMQKIDHYAFCRCTSLTSLSLPDSIAEIGNCAFSGCTSLSEITLPEQLKKLGYNVFNNTAFTTVTIPASLNESRDSFYEGPFANSAVETAVFAEGTVGVPANLFEKAINLNVVEFLSPETVTSIGSNAFRGCSSLSSFIVPENVTKLNSYAFSDCAGLLSVYIPNALLTPGANAFKNCSSLLVVHCPAGANAETYAANNGITCHTDLRYDTQPITLCSGETVSTGTVYCRVCERLLTQKSLITPEGHIETEIPAVKATCKAEGRTAGKECGACKTVLLEPETIPKADHIPVKDPAKPPTCTKNGLTAGSHCAYCNAVLVEREVVMATGHFDTLTEGEEPDGVCDICGRKAEESRVTYAIRRVGALFEGWLRLLSRLLRLFSKTKP
ncbi:MAG: leucine-rich repeat protein [Clostridia bacterium]|nr:leucine-rich repeat protein [Clostridia bacterium]